MSGAQSIIRGHARRMRVAQLTRYAVYALPVLIVVSYALQFYSDLALSACLLWAVGVAGLQVLLVDLLRHRRRVTIGRTVEHLDRRFAQLGDSTALLMQPAAALSPLQRLQQKRVSDALEGLAAKQALQPSGYRRLPRAVALSLLLSAVMVNLLWVVPEWQQRERAAPAGADNSIDQVIVDVAPPAYTGLENAQSDSPSLSIAERAEVRFTVAMTERATQLQLITGDGQAIDLYAAGDGRWQSTWWQPQATTYRFVADGNPVPVSGQGLVHKIGVIADQPPSVRIVSPVSRLQTVSDSAVRPIDVVIEVSDDYGVSEVAARVTRSSGSGEQVSFEEAQLPVYAAPETSVRDLRLENALDAKQLGLAPGSELYVHFEARDGAADGGHVGESQTLVLRWLGDDQAPDIVLDNQVVQVMPEYFRSQRQIIIDSEALLAERGTIGEDAFDQRAQSLALDQKALRLRYGQFMGEEDDSEPAAMPSGESSEGEDHYAGDGHDHANDDFGEGGGHYAGDGHDHADDDFVAASRPGASEFGDAEAAIEPYAHFHDQEEQATLFDPQTRGLLREALSAMWLAEGELRQFRPEPSLPHQYRALAMIKRVQNRARVFVARVGFEPTPVDPERRLTGELDDIAATGELADRSRQMSDGRVSMAMVALLASRELVASDAPGIVLDWLEQRRVAAAALRDDPLLSAVLDAEAALRQWQLDTSCGDCQRRLSAFWQAHAPEARASAARARQPFDAFAPPDASP